MGRVTGALLLLLLLAGAGVSGVLLLEHHGEPLSARAAEALCDATTGGGCDAVAHSEYAELGGVSLAAIGVGFYLSLSLLVGLGAVGGSRTRAASGGVALVAVGLALVVDLMLLGVQAFAIHAFCGLCILTYVVNLAAFVLLYGARRSLGGIVGSLGHPEGRVAVAGWLAGTLAVAVAVLMADVALAGRAQARQANILGSVAPAPAATPASEPPSPEPSPASEAPAEPTPAEAVLGTPEDASGSKAAALQARLDAALADARRLQGILDDPRQLAAYQDQKAQKEWETAERQKVDLATTPAKGAASAPITVVEYSDFLCPFCRNLAEGFSQFVPQAGGRVRLYFKNYPLDKECSPELRATVHPGACQVALGAICAQDQDRFWEYHDKVFSAPPSNPGADDVARIAASAGLDGARLRACMDDPKTRVRLTEDIAEGRRIGVTGTPTVLVNGKKLPRIGDFLQAVEDESRRLGLPPLAPAAGH